MRSRGLLPLAALLVVAMIAVPYYLASQGSDEGPPVVADAPQSAAELAPENQARSSPTSPACATTSERLADQQREGPLHPAVPGLPGGDRRARELAAPAARRWQRPSVEAAAASSEIDDAEQRRGRRRGTAASPRRSTTPTRPTSSSARSARRSRARNRVGYFDYLPSQDAPVLSYMGTLNGGKQAVFLGLARTSSPQTGGGSCFPTPESLPAARAGPEARPRTSPTVRRTRSTAIKIERIKLVGHQEASQRLSAAAERPLQKVKHRRYPVLRCLTTSAPYAARRT